MSTRTAAGLLAGAGIGAGLLLLAVALRGTPAEAVPRCWQLGRGRQARLAAGLAAALLVLAATGWIAAAAGVGLLVAAGDRLLGGGRGARLALARLDGLAIWTESLRDLIATGIALPEALPASVPACPPVLAEPLAGLVDRLAARQGIEPALRALADELADPGADVIIAALILNVRAQGRALVAVLGALAESARAELSLRRGIEAERRSGRRAVQFVVATTVASALGLAVLNPTYVAPYRTAAGQLVLTVVVGIFAAGFIWLARLAALPTAGRIWPAGARAQGPR